MPEILFVGEGNVCRSVLAERILRTAVADRWDSDLQISSAGIDARVGEPMDEMTAEIASSLGVDHTHHEARTVNSEHLRDASLVLTGTRKQRAAVVRLRPAAVKYTLTIRQFGHIIEDSLGHPELSAIEEAPFADRLAALLSFVIKRRGRRLRPDPAVDDVIDPCGQPRHLHETAARQMLPALNHVALSLGGREVEWVYNRV